MAFYKKVQQKINKKWYPQSITVGTPVTTRQVADRLARISTVSRADVAAVLGDLAGVLADYMAEGRTVKLEGLGTFYYTINAARRGKDTPEEVTAADIAAVRVRFIPEARKGASAARSMTRALVSDDITWSEWTGEDTATDDDSTTGGTPGAGEGEEEL